MDTEIYKGSSDGFRYLLDGYLDYADEVISRRAIPDVRDGLKVVQRWWEVSKRLLQAFLL